MTSVLLLVSAAVLHDQTPLRSACDLSAGAIAMLPTGLAIEIRFAIQGELGACYKVSAETGGRQLEGYLPASAIQGLDQFEKARQTGQPLDAPTPRARRGAQARAAAQEVAQAEDLAVRASRLLSANRPAEALTFLETALRDHRRNPELLAMAGMAAQQSDRLRDAIGYWEDSLALAANPNIGRMLERARKELASDQSSQQLVGIRFTFRYDDTRIQPEHARALVPVLDSEFLRVSSELGCRYEERVAAVIQDKNAYLASTGAAEWSGGLYDGRIRIASLEPVPGEHTRRTFAHEIVHSCLVRLGSWPAWLHEGLAQKISGQTLTPELREKVQRMARDKTLPSLAKIGQTWFRLSPRHASTAYATALYAAEMLYAHYGSEGVRSLLQAPERLPEITRDLDMRIRQ